jgi:hypothetical protein
MQNAAILRYAGKLDANMHVIACGPLRIVRIEHGKTEAGVMCLDLVERIIALANLTDDIVAMIAVSAGRGDAEAGKADQRQTRGRMRDTGILCANPSQQAIISDVWTRAHANDHGKRDKQTS